MDKNEKRRISRVAKRVLEWFKHNGRQFPWRKPNVSEYEQICVEILLQRTRAESVAKQYSAFFTRFPNWIELSLAGKGEIESILKPLGLWRRRAASLLAFASYAVSVKGKFPLDREELESIPAVGQYVANAIFLFQHKLPAPLLDTNMARVIERYFRPRELADIRHDPMLQAISKELVSSAGADAVAVNWGFLDIGGVLCKPEIPQCVECPLRNGCFFRRQLFSKPTSH